MNIRFVKTYQQYRKGQLVNISFTKGLWYIKKGYAIADKMLTNFEVK